MVNTLQSKRGLNEEARKKGQEPGMQAMEGRRLGPPCLPPPPPYHHHHYCEEKRYCVEKINNKVIMVKRE